MAKPYRKFIKVMAIAGTTLMVTYAAACAYLWARQEHYIFMPERRIKKTPSALNLPYQDVYVTVSAHDGNHERIHGWWISPKQTLDHVLLYLHGSALNIGANVDHARRFYQLGFAVFLISYRGYGLSDGEFPSEESVYADAEAAWAYLVDTKGIDPHKIFIYGHSIGGAIAIDLAVGKPQAAGLIVESTFTSIVDVAHQKPGYKIFPLPFLVHQRFDSLAKIADIRMPVLFIHGTSDDLIPFEMSRTLYERTPSPKQLVLIPGGGHINNALIGGNDYLQAVNRFAAWAKIAANG